jgi:hypothetical protein
MTAVTTAGKIFAKITSLELDLDEYDLYNKGYLWHKLSNRVYIWHKSYP